MKSVGIGLISVLALMMVGCGNKGGGSLATVNGEAISQDKFNKYLTFKPQVNVVASNGQVAQAQVAETLGYQAFQDLLRQSLITQLAKDEKLYPTNEEIESEVKFLKKQNANFITQLNGVGLNLQEIKEAVAVDMCRERILTKGIKISNVEVDLYIEKNPKQFIEPSTADLRWVFVKTSDLREKVNSELKAGQTFSSVAARYSQFQGAKEGGRFPQRVVASMNPQVQQLVQKHQPGQLTDWIRLSDGWAKFYVEAKTPAKKVKIDDTVREALRRQIALNRGLQAVDLDARLLAKMKSSDIVVTDRSLKTKWEASLKQLEEIEAQQRGTEAERGDGLQAPPAK